MAQRHKGGGRRPRDSRGASHHSLLGSLTPGLQVVISNAIRYSTGSTRKVGRNMVASIRDPFKETCAQRLSIGIDGFRKAIAQRFLG